MDFKFIRCEKRQKEFVLRLYESVYEHTMAEVEYNWRYKENPSGNSISFFCLYGDRPVGVLSFLPWRLSVGKTEYLTYQGSDGMVDPAFQRKRIFQNLTKEAFKEFSRMNIAGLFEFTNEKSTIPSLRAGWKSLGDLIVIVKVLNWSRFIFSKINIQLLSIIGNRLWKFENYIKGNIKGLVNIKMKEVKRFDRNINTLLNIFEDTLSDHQILAKRDHVYLNWKYVENPVHKSSIFYFLDSSDKIIGYVVVRENKKEAIIQDLVLLPQSAHSCIKTFSYFFMKKGFVTIRGAFGAGTPYLSALKNNGFILRKDKFPMLVKVIGSNARKELGERNNWFFTLGDRDTA